MVSSIQIWDKYFKQVSANEYQYYPEDKRAYSVNGGKPKTQSQKVECNIANLAKKGIDPMPTWRDEYNFNVPEGKFRMLTGRHAQFTQSGTANNAMLKRPHHALISGLIREWQKRWALSLEIMLR